MMVFLWFRYAVSASDRRCAQTMLQKASSIGASMFGVIWEGLFPKLPLTEDQRPRLWPFGLTRWVRLGWEGDLLDIKWLDASYKVSVKGDTVGPHITMVLLATYSQGSKIVD